MPYQRHLFIYLFISRCLSAFVLASVVTLTPPLLLHNTLAKMEVCFFFCFFEMFSVVTNQMSVNTVCLANASVFSRPGLCVPVFACKRRVVLSVLTALQVNKPQLPVSVLIFPRDFDGQGAETVVGDGAGACLGSYLLCIGRHHFQHPVSLPPPPPPFTLLSLSWTRTVGPPDAARTR